MTAPAADRAATTATARQTEAAAGAALLAALGHLPVREYGAVDVAVRRAVLAAYRAGVADGWAACAVEHHLPTD